MIRTYQYINTHRYNHFCYLHNLHRNKMPVITETVTENLLLGEGPHWDTETQTLHLVDIFDGSVVKYKPSTNEYAKVKIGKNVSFVIPVEGAKNKFVVSTLNELKVITWDGTSDKVESVEKIVQIDATRGTAAMQFNDAKADRLGRLWVGSLGITPPKPGKEVGTENLASKAGSLYSLEQGKLRKHLDGISVSNGLAFNDDLNKFYYIDSLERSIFQFDYNPTNGTISNQETIFTLEHHNIEGIPDGLTIDADGNLWIAIYNGYRVIKIDPRENETLLQTITFSVKDITSVAFGGPNLDELYVTTGGGAEAKKTVSDAGKTFVVKGLGVRGLPAKKVKL